jgi:GNAT superfamily N-acetyltransferase
MSFTLRRATLDDRPALEELIAESVRGLSREDYTSAQIEAALGNTMGVDSELIRDGTYFVAEADGQIVACGGWSRRKTLFGADARAERQPELLDPTNEPARVRAFFVRPAWARRGLGRALLERCEAEARAAGFRRAALVATLPGLRLYEALGYVAEAPIEHDLGGGLMITFVPMGRDL